MTWNSVSPTAIEGTAYSLNQPVAVAPQSVCKQASGRNSPCVANWRFVVADRRLRVASLAVLCRSACVGRVVSADVDACLVEPAAWAADSNVGQVGNSGEVQTREIHPPHNREVLRNKLSKKSPFRAEENSERRGLAQSSQRARRKSNGGEIQEVLSMLPLSQRPLSGFPSDTVGLHAGVRSRADCSRDGGSK